MRIRKFADDRLLTNWEINIRYTNMTTMFSLSLISKDIAIHKLNTVANSQQGDERQFCHMAKWLYFSLEPNYFLPNKRAGKNGL